MHAFALCIILFVALLATLAVPTAGQTPDQPSVAIVDVGMVSRSLRISLATSRLWRAGDPPATATVSIELNGHPLRTTFPLIGMPDRFAVDLELAAGVVRIGGISVAEFPPRPPLDENTRIPVKVTVRRGLLTGTARALAVIPLPTVIVTGYLNELAGPDEEVLAVFRRHGYRDGGPAVTLFWFGYPSLRMELRAAAHDLDAYVQQVVLPATYASKINVVGYSLGGLLARWNIAFVPRWNTLVNRLVLLGVPNQGAVMPYVYRHASPLLPYMWWAQTVVARQMWPTFPFWRATASDRWRLPLDAQSPLLAQLNARRLPQGIRVSVFYADASPLFPLLSGTIDGVTGEGPGATLSYGPGDGIVPLASAAGLPLHGGSGVAAFEGHAIRRTNIGRVGHLSLLRAAAEPIAAWLLDRIQEPGEGREASQRRTATGLGRADHAPGRHRGPVRR